MEPFYLRIDMLLYISFTYFKIHSEVLYLEYGP